MSSSLKFQLLKQSLFELAKQKDKLPSQVISLFLQKEQSHKEGQSNSEWLLLTTSDHLIWSFDKEFMEGNSPG